MKSDEKAKRKKTLFYFGFGADVMKNTTVCANCNSLESSRKIFCSKCGTRLPVSNLYDYYKAQHKKCKKCGTVLSDFMVYCPRCGVSVSKECVNLKRR